MSDPRCDNCGRTAPVLSTVKAFQGKRMICPRCSRALCVVLKSLAQIPRKEFSAHPHR